MMENKATPSLEHLIQVAVNNKSDFVKINNDVYAAIRPNEILYVRADEIDKFREYFINFKEKPINNVLSVTFVPTLDCNLNCIYCYSRGGDFKQYMSSSMAKAFLKSLYKPIKHSFLHLRFAGGGESFLNFDCIKETTETAKEISNNVSLHCITNGTFNEEHLNWILRERPHMRISYDGVYQKLQRQYRDSTDSTDIVRRNIERLVEEGIETITQTTITSLNISKMKEMVSEADILGVKTIKMEPVYITKNSRGNDKLNISPSEFVSNFVNAVKYIWENNLDIQIDTAFFSRPTLGHYCNLATGNLVLTPSGDISGCVEITNNYDFHADNIFYGRFDEGSGRIKFNKYKQNSFKNFHFANYQDCNSCNLKLICKGGCPLRRIWDQKDHSCEITKRLVPQILRLIYEDQDYAKIFIKK